jgi:SSS family solute:Na+ symporter
VFGGFLSIVITDTLQFFILASGLIGLFFYLLISFPVKTLHQIVSGLGKHSYFDFFSNIGHSVLVMISFLLAWLVSPITWQRIQSSRTVRDAKKALTASSIAFVLLYGCIVGIGMLSLLCFPDGTQEGPLLSAIIINKAGKLLGSLLFLAVVAAIMSTMDTAINTGALSLTRDVFQQIIPKWSQKRVVVLSRSATIITGALAFIIASRLKDILKTLGLASEIMAEGLFVPGLAMLFIRKKYPLAGLFSLILGGGYSITGFFCEMNILNFPWPEWPQSVPYGVILSFSGFLLGLFLSSKKKNNS